MTEKGDFIGINYYMRQTYKHAWYVPLMRARLKKVEGAEESAMWEVYPKGLYNLLIRLRDEYGNPECHITENGYPLIEEDGKPILEDMQRISYLERHFREAARAIEEGVNLHGYYVWTLMDNFEWAFGNRMRFGLVRTDFETLERSWKKSAYWYRELIAKGAI
jgi:beta-glucosidase